MVPFDPLFTDPHLQTIAAHFWPRDGGERSYPLQARLCRTGPEIEVLVETQRPGGPARGELLMVHGLEGSGAAGYVRSLAGAALARGFAVHRFHMRTCGGNEALCPTLYHAGLTGDLAEVLRQLGTPAALVGFSLGGNVVLKLAGELGDRAPSLIRCACAVSTPLDLAACARRIHQRENWLYERRFVRKMKQRLRATGRYSPADYESLRSIVELDDRITAPSFGFGNAANYYATQSCGQFLAGIRVPTLLIQAKDDTLVPFASYQDPALWRNPCVRLLATEHGGHLGFLARRRPRFWLDEVILEFLGVG